MAGLGTLEECLSPLYRAEGINARDQTVQVRCASDLSLLSPGSESVTFCSSEHKPQVPKNFGVELVNPALVLGIPAWPPVLG